MCYYFCALLKPLFNAIGVRKQVADTFDCDLGQIGGSPVQFAICLEYLLFFELLLDLVAGADESDTVDTRHDSLLDCFTVDFALQAFSNFEHTRISFVLDVAKD